MSRGQNQAGLIFVQGEQREGALEPVDGLREGRAQIARDVKQVTHQDGSDLGVGVAGKLVAGGKHLSANLGIVLNNAVVNQGEFAVVSQMRMRVGVNRGAVRGPARVSDAR